MARRQTRALVVAGAVIAVAAIGAVVSSVQDGRQLRLDNPLDPRPYVQKQRTERRARESRESMAKLIQAMSVYASDQVVKPETGKEER